MTLLHIVGPSRLPHKKAESGEHAGAKGGKIGSHIESATALYILCSLTCRCMEKILLLTVEIQPSSTPST